MVDHLEPGDRRLRILHVLRAPLGGLFRHVVDLATEQAARGHAVGLIVDSLTGGERAVAHLAELGTKLELGIKRLPMLRQPHSKDFSALYEVDAHVRRLGVDVVHGHGSKGGLYARAPALWRGRKGPIRCYTPHGGSFNHVASPLVQGIYMGVERVLAAYTDVLLFESVFIANRFRERIGQPSALVRIVQNGIGDNEFVPVAPNPSAADFVYVGELRAAKGIDTLIDAMAVLSRRFGKMHRLLLVGSGPDKEKLEARANIRGVQDQISFPGPHPAREAFKLGRILVVPSRAESLPYIVLEGVGAQIPIVSTDVGGIGEIFGPYRDRLIGCDDPVALADAMQRTVEADPAIVKQQAEDLAAFVSTRFVVSIMADSVMGGYRDAFARRAAPTPAAKTPIVLPS